MNSRWHSGGQCTVLAGGMGTRLGALTERTPKSLLPCGDRPIRTWLPREFVRFGVESFILLTGHLAEEIDMRVQEVRPSRRRYSRSAGPAVAARGAAARRTPNPTAATHAAPAGN